MARFYSDDFEGPQRSLRRSRAWAALRRYPVRTDGRRARARVGRRGDPKATKRATERDDVNRMAQGLTALVVATLLTVGTSSGAGLEGKQQTITTGTTERFRGVSAPAETTVWASGTGGTVVRSLDGGTTWDVRTVAGAEQLDLRDVDAFGPDYRLRPQHRLRQRLADLQDGRRRRELGNAVHHARSQPASSMRWPFGTKTAVSP